METALIVLAGITLVMGVGTVMIGIMQRYDGAPSPQDAYDGYWEGY